MAKKVSRARNTINQRACLYLYNQMEGQEFIVFDTETTGLKPEKDYIVEFAGQKFRIENGKAVHLEDIDLFIRPPFLLEQKVIDVHGLTNEFLATQPPEKTLFPQIKSFFGNKPLVIGYNVDFDVAMVRSMYKRNSTPFTPFAVLDVLEMVRDNLYGKEFDNYKLGFIAEKLGVDAGLTFHSAIDDVKATYRVLEYCHNEYKTHPALDRESREHIILNRIWYWKGYQHNQSGIYLDTNFGKLHYSTFKKAWFSSDFDLSDKDIDSLEKEVINNLRVASPKELGRITEKKFNEIKFSLRKEGIYL